MHAEYVCTCGKWLVDNAAGAWKNNAYWMQGALTESGFDMTLLERRAHTGCGMHLRKVAFDDAAGA